MAEGSTPTTGVSDSDLTDREQPKTFDLIRTSGLNQNDMIVIYDSWADQYDKDKQVFADKQQVVYQTVLDMVERAFPDHTDIRILDIGAGTGILGTQLKEAGYTNIDAVDISPKMLEVAKQHNTYTNLYAMSIGSEPIPLETDCYDLLVSIGSFLKNHISEECFEELIRITKPGGKLVITMHYKVDDPSYADSFLTKLDRLAADGQWEVKEKKDMEVETANAKACVVSLQTCR